MRMDLAEGRKNLIVRRAKCIRADGPIRNQRSRHVPVAQNHAKRGIALPAQGIEKLVEGVRIEVAHEPFPGLAEHWLAAKVEERQVQLCILKWTGHVQPPRSI